MLGAEFFLGTLMTPLLILIGTILLYWYSVRNFDYWKKRNVPYVKPYPFVGSVVENMRKFTRKLVAWETDESIHFRKCEKDIDYIKRA
ncbi:hypothetical protein TNCT_5271 [Trichonephila clavata]|uniref:Cytochrome P450 n=1 Tax=Trichonephila clavata TaxID=2740835 RepID=A0A8X6FWY1_TRICU|nr:hypothetical protein TNCT_5271 [Trichonephila clavata]